MGIRILKEIVAFTVLYTWLTVKFVTLIRENFKGKCQNVVSYFICTLANARLFCSSKGQACPLIT